MLGGFEYVPEQPHGCPLPTVGPFESVPKGARWRCDCGLLYEVRVAGPLAISRVVGQYYWKRIPG